MLLGSELRGRRESDVRPSRCGGPWSLHRSRLEDRQARARACLGAAEGVAVLVFFSSRRRHTRLQGDWSSDVCSSDLAFWIACGFSGVPNPASVTTLPLPTAESGVTQERIAWPLRCTVQAPHCATPQPKCGLLSPRSLRSAYSSGMSGSASMVWLLPFTSRGIRAM